VEDGVVADVRLALGAVGTKPWRARRAEAELVGGPASEAAFRRAAAAELEAAVVREHNAFKVELAQRAIVRGLSHCLNGRSS
jgi:xanthine dehydrogenase YagS FAD-binding subunit